MTTQGQCAKAVWHPVGSWGHSAGCTRNATIERNGKWWCWQHDPEAVKKRREKRDAEGDAEHDAKMARWRREAAAMAAVEGFSTEALEAGVVADLLAACERVARMWQSGEGYCHWCGGLSRHDDDPDICPLPLLEMVVAKTKTESEEDPNGA
jgi:hypothetical protein|tara:strand:+ start:219 stop:674 length:456 start_codon:yes stop_codon:yes gene_type:complete